MRTCFFLGAGASAEFGYPVTAQILPSIRAGLRYYSLFSFRDDRKDLCSRLLEFITQLFPGFAEVDEENLPSIVELLSLLDHSLRSSIAPVRLVPVHELAELRTLLEVAICEVVYTQTKSGIPAAFAFWRWISSKNNRKQDSVGLISTNYDTSIEQLIAKSLGNTRRISEQVDFGVSWRDPDRPKTYPRPTVPWLRFYKLHGSLNWLRCDMCEHMYLNSRFEIFKRVLDAKVSGKNSCHCGHGRLSLMLVTPSYVRDVREPNLLAIWQNALELLRTSDNWVIVGYSLPPDDINIRSMLMRAVHARGAPPRITLVLDKVHPEILARYRLLFPDIKPYLQGFGPYIKQLG